MENYPYILELQTRIGLDSGLQVCTNRQHLLTLVVAGYGFCCHDCDDDNDGGDDVAETCRTNMVKMMLKVKVMIGLAITVEP